MISFSSLSKRRGATLAGVFSLAFSCVVLLCGAGSVPVENLLPQGAMQGDLNAGGHNLTNAATVYATAVSATDVVVSGSLTAPSSFTLPFSQLTSLPTTLSGYGISDPVVLTTGGTFTGTVGFGTQNITAANWGVSSSGYINAVLFNGVPLAAGGSASAFLNGAGNYVAVPWSSLTGTPTSLAGYGISDPIVLTSGSYANPSWLTSLAWSKLTGTPTTLSGYGISDPVVLTSGSYADPAWITSLAASKLTGTLPAARLPAPTGSSYGGVLANGPVAHQWVNAISSGPPSLSQPLFSDIGSTPTTLAGYGITDPIVLTSGSYADPAWITSLSAGKLTGTVTATAIAWSGVTSTPTSAVGYGIANGATLDTLAASNPFTAGSGITFTGTWPVITITASSVSWPLVSTDGNLSFGSTGGTLGYVDDSGNAVFASLTSPIVGGTGSTPASGNVGYEASSLVTSAVSLSNGITTTIATISNVPPGHYLVSGHVTFAATTATVTALTALTSITANAAVNVSLAPQLVAASGTNSCTLDTQPWNPTSTQTLTLKAKATFSAGTVTGIGAIYIWQAP